jgi:hypothetical protein
MDIEDDDFFEATEDIESALPMVLAPEAIDLDAETLDDVFSRIADRLSPQEAESLGSALRSVGKWANNRGLGQVASTVLPAAATAIGTAYGGPLGGAVGRAVGQRAAQAVGGPQRRAPSPAPTATPSAAPPQPAATSAPVGDGSQAAGKLLYLVQNPAFLSSLVALALGSQGTSTVPLGPEDKQVPVGALVNVAASLAGEVAEDADALSADTETISDEYLRDESGRLTCDPAVPRDRAHALLGLLQREDEWQLGDTEGEWDTEFEEDDPW